MIKIFCSKNWKDYELLDTGEGEKLERVGKYIFVRPYESAFWKKSLKKEVWDKVDGKFWSSKVGAKAGWVLKNKKIEKWEIDYGGIKFLAMPTPFRHFGFFPEQVSHWDFIEDRIKSFLEQEKNSSALLHPSGGTFRRQNSSLTPKIKFLNLFGYTGVASLFALRAGAEVTHVDASKQSLNWAKENQKLNTKLAEAPMRIIEDDILKFIEREIKRGNKYDAIIMDPPKFGRGPKGETWKLETDLPKLMNGVKKILSDKPLFVILTSYATDISSLSLGNLLQETMQDFNGKTESGELCILEKSKNRMISLANTAVWE